MVSNMSYLKENIYRLMMSKGFTMEDYEPQSEWAKITAQKIQASIKRSRDACILKRLRLSQEVLKRVEDIFKSRIVDKNL